MRSWVCGASLPTRTSNASVRSPAVSGRSRDSAPPRAARDPRRDVRGVPRRGGPRRPHSQEGVLPAGPVPRRRRWRRPPCRCQHGKEGDASACAEDPQRLFAELLVIGARMLLVFLAYTLLVLGALTLYAT